MTQVVDQIKTEFETFSSRFGPSTIITATVTAVNADDTITAVTSDGVEHDDIRLRSVVKAGNKVISIPKLQSKVLIGKIENGDSYVVIAVEEIDDIIMIIGTVRFSFNQNGFLFEKGNDTLKDALKLIVEAVQVIVVMDGNNPNYQKLAQALNKINNLFV